MHLPKWLDCVLKSKYLQGGAALATVITFFFTVAANILQLPCPLFTLVYNLMAIAAPAFVITTIYSVRFRGENQRLIERSTIVDIENQRLRQCATTLHRINHIYRDVLNKTFGIQLQQLGPLEATERDTLVAVCYKIAEMFSLLIGEKCVVTVKLITKDANTKDYCHTLARSEPSSERDLTLVNYEINTGRNTAFDTALRYDGHRTSRFFSADLEKDADMGKYFNDRTDWKRFYRSAIVVPIRYVHYDAVGTPTAFNELGFLAIDTIATYKLNDHFHIEYLAAFADQMYNFMSLMRGKYCLKITPPSQLQ